MKRSVVMLLALVGCGSDGSGKRYAAVFYSCDARSQSAQCWQYVDDGSVNPDEVTGARSSCDFLQGAWGQQSCDSAGALGRCRLPTAQDGYTATVWLYPSTDDSWKTAGDGQHFCESSFGGQWSSP